MKTARVILAVSLLALAAVPLAAAADDAVDPAAKQRLHHLLNGYERIPKPKEIHAIPDVDRVLEALWNDPNEPAHVRARALSSFTYLPADNERANRVLQAAAQDEKLNPIFRRVAVKSLVTLRGEAALPVVRPMLAHAEFPVRDAAVEALGHLAPKVPAAAAALRERLSIETSAVVRERIERALAGPGALPPALAPSVPAAAPAQPQVAPELPAAAAPAPPAPDGLPAP